VTTTSAKPTPAGGKEGSFAEPGNERVPVYVWIVLLVVLGVIAADVVITDSWCDAIPMFVLIGIVVAMLLAVGPLAQPLAGIRRHVAADSWLLPPIGFVAVILILGEQSDQERFFEAAAQVLPVLALALAIEATALHEQLKGRSGRSCNCTYDVRAHRLWRVRGARRPRRSRSRRPRRGDRMGCVGGGGARDSACGLSASVEQCQVRGVSPLIADGGRCS
jgi:hypothetical protein